MQEKKRQEKIRLSAPLEKVTTEILAANGRSIEPFIKVFNYSGENITTSPLGALVGVFEVAEQSEDSAYIVNFLASVAKKEYFNNPRRGAIESFEAALHKINLALAELVKHGNIAWLGKLHGVLGVLEKNNLHFSVTGKAEILLLRNNTLSEISAGLASDESSLHPIKTFVEVSSGRLMVDDKIILTSPELFTLLSPEDLEKNALRMDSERFAQFLRTALVNELDMAGTIIVDIYESKPLPAPKKQEEKSAETMHNVFSQKAFVPQIKAKEAAPEVQGSEIQETFPSEYIDSKTGHIYVQGDTPEGTPSHPNIERIRLFLQDGGQGISRFLSSQGKLLRKARKQSFILFDAFTEHGSVIIRKSSRFLRRQLKRGIASIRSKASSLRLPKKPKARQEIGRESEVFQTVFRPLAEPQSAPVERKKEVSASIDTGDEEIPPFMKEKLAAFYQKNDIPESQTASAKIASENFQKNIRGALRFIQEAYRTGSAHLSSLWRGMLSQTRNFFRHMILFWRGFLPHRQKIILAGSALALVVLIAGIFFWTRPSRENTPDPIEETPQEQSGTSAFPLDTEKNARLLRTSALLATEEDGVIASVLLDTEIYLITSEGILNVREQKRYALPAGSGAPQLAAPMDDLRLIFIYTDTRELFAWSPISHTFTKNILTLPEGSRVKDIGTYLTYLYVLDDATDQIYRFPRAEGGFGASSVWLRDTVAIEETAKIAVNETIFLAPDKNAVQAFFRGKFVRNLESPATPLSVTSLFTRPGLANVYALDTENKRILVWNQDGVLIAQYFSEQLSEAQTIIVNENTNEVLISTHDTLLSFKLEK